MIDFQADIEEDLKAENAINQGAKFEGFAKMSKANLIKQDKKILMQYCEENNLLEKGLTERQKSRLTRKQLADLIKPSTKRESKAQEDTNTQELNTEFEKYQTAFLSATNGDFTHFDSLAHNNVMGFVSQSVNNGGEMSERAQKIIAVLKIGLSGAYLLVRFTGGVSKWKEHATNLFSKIKSKVKKKKNV